MSGRLDSRWSTNKRAAMLNLDMSCTQIANGRRDQLSFNGIAAILRDVSCALTDVDGRIATPSPAETILQILALLAA